MNLELIGKRVKKISVLESLCMGFKRKTWRCPVNLSKIFESICKGIKGGN